MGEHYIVTVDGEHLRIFAETRRPAQFRPTLRVVAAVDLESGGGSEEMNDVPIDTPFRLAAKKRPPEQERHQSTPERKRASRKRIARLASDLETFLQQRPQASWDLAAAHSVFDGIVNRLSADTLRRLKRVLSEELVEHQDEEDVSAHFALTA